MFSRSKLIWEISPNLLVYKLFTETLQYERILINQKTMIKKTVIRILTQNQTHSAFPDLSRFLSFFSNLNKFRSFSPQPSQGTSCLLAPSSCRSGCRPQWGWSSGVRSQSCTNHSSRTTSQTRCEECEPKIILCNNECCGRVFKYHNHKKQICVPFLEV